ncbi:P-loop NTPase family protein [Natronorarus salvus]|uniref:hypothetical protein n=1 Tax=Natronorarus salvus TaxID=3117733 RepID=UPI002F268176
MRSEPDPPPIPELPTLGTGIRMLETEDRPIGPLHALVVDHVSLNRGPAYWIDTHGHATTQPLARLVSDRRLLDRIQVARGFTPWQHYSLVQILTERINENTSLLILPALDGMYRDDALRDGEGTTMLVRVLANLAGLAREYDLPILVTRTHDDGLTAPIEAAAVETIRCERTRMGPRFTAESFETLVYPLGNGQFQTTLAYWTEILSARQPLYDAAQAGLQTPEVPVDGSY